MIISMIVAMGNKREIGLKNKLPWHIPEDLKKFKELTLNHHILMGRKTYESILSSFGKPLPKRTTLVVTRNEHYKAEGSFVVRDIKTAIEFASKNKETELFICGGAEIYAQSFPFVTRIYLSRVHYEGEADAYLKEFDLSLFKKKDTQQFDQFQFEVWEKL